MSDELEVESLFRSANEVVFFLYTREASLEHIDGVECRVGTDAPLDWPRSLPFLYNVVDLVLYNLVLCNNLELQPRCS